MDEGGEALDEVMAVLLRAPRTYTREDMAEIHCHGGSACASAVLRRVLSLGARAAEPGEFTRRAYENGRIDLSRAEAVMQLVGAQGEAARRAALRQMRGGVAGFVDGAVEQLTDMLSRIQAAVDFPEEVDEAAVGAQVRVELEELAGQIEERADPRRARMLREGASVVLCGRPNVGKSSLMNALLSAERAIVTDIPGTTRDVLSERFTLGGKVVRLSDTAGIRESEDAIERMGVERAQGEVEAADVALLVLDASQPLAAEDAALLSQVDERYIVCLNKGDLPAVLTAADVEAFLGGSVGKEGQGDVRAGVSACCAGAGGGVASPGAVCTGAGGGVVKGGTAGQGDSCEAGSAGAGVAALGVVEEGGTACQSVACAGEGVRDVLQGAVCAGACVDVVKGGTAGQGAACAGVSACCSDEDVRKVVQSAVCAGLGGGVTSPGAVCVEAGGGAVKDGTAGQGVACAGVSSSRVGESVTDVVQSAACAGLGGGVISPGAVCAEAGDGAVKDETAGREAACEGVSACCSDEDVRKVVQGAACAGADAFPASGELSAGEAGRSCALAAGGRSVPVVSLCAATGEGVAELLLRLRERLDAAAGEEECFTVERQLHLAREAADLLRNCAQALQEGFSPDVVAPDILKACALLDSVTGRDASEAVIDAIFANFCVGK